MDKVEKIVRKKQFITSQIGNKKLGEVMTALDRLSEEFNLTPAQLVDITQYHRLEVLLPSIE